MSMSDNQYDQVREQGSKDHQAQQAERQRLEAEMDKYDAELLAQEEAQAAELDRLNRETQERQSRELFGVKEAPVKEPPKEPVDTDAQPDPAPIVEDPVTPEPVTQIEDTEIALGTLNKKVTKTINGKKVTKTLHEWMRDAVKVGEADEYLAAATKKLLEATPQEPEEVLDDETLLEAFESGDKAQRLEALRKIREGSARQAQKQAHVEAQRLAGQKVFAEFVASNPLFKDPEIRAIACNYADRLLAQGKRYSPDMVKDLALRLELGGKYAVDWYNKHKFVQTQETKLEEARKHQQDANLPDVQSPTTRTQRPAPQSGPQLSQEQLMQAWAQEELEQNDNAVLRY